MSVIDWASLFSIQWGNVDCTFVKTRWKVSPESAIVYKLSGDDEVLDNKISSVSF